MPNYFYIKNGGTAVGDEGRYAIQQTGSFATLTNYYNSIQDATAATNPPVPGDFVCVSNLHIASLSTPSATYFTDKTIYISVDDTDIVTYLAGAVYGLSTGIASITLANMNSWVYGISLFCDNILTLNIDTSYLKMVDSTINAQSVTVTGAGGEFVGHNVNIDNPNISAYYNIASAINFSLYGGTCNNTTKLFSCSDIYGSNISINDYNFSALLGDLVEITAGAKANIEFNRCLLNQNTGIKTIGTVLGDSSSISLSSCNNGIAYNDYHYFRNIVTNGDVIETTAIYRTEGATYDTINHFAAEVQTNNFVEKYANPLVYTLGNYELDLSVSRQLTFHVLQQDALNIPANLNQHECWVEIESPDATNNVLGIITSAQQSNIMETPIELSLSNQDWTGSTGNIKKNQITVVIPASISKAPIRIKLCVAKDLTIADSNGADSIEMFVCPRPEIV